jgi:hypothetical protein
VGLHAEHHYRAGVAQATREALDLDAYGIVDQSASFAPPGVSFMRAPNDDWKMVAQRMIRRAHSIVLILPAGQDMRDGFAWEIQQIVRYRRQSRVVVVLPPFEGDPRGYANAMKQVRVLRTMLGAHAGSAVDTAEFPTRALVMKCTERGGMQHGIFSRTRHRPRRPDAGADSARRSWATRPTCPASWRRSRRPSSSCRIGASMRDTPEAGFAPIPGHPTL